MADLYEFRYESTMQRSDRMNFLYTSNDKYLNEEEIQLTYES